MIDPNKNITEVKKLNILEEELVESRINHDSLLFPTLETPIKILENYVKKFQKLLLHGSNSTYKKIIAYENKILELFQSVKNSLNVNPDLDNYGNKHSNLIKLENILSHLNINGVYLPVPVGLGSDLIENFLREFKPEIFIQRNFLAEKVKEYQQAPSTSCFFDDPEVKRSLAIIHLAISEAFLENKDRLDHPLITDAIDSQLEKIKQNQSYLMVRSTGTEDSDKMSNAGGNVSKAYVFPAKDSFLSAAEEVICSYFSETSLRNCINAKQNPFLGKPELAVTTQELIGEPVGDSSAKDQIPISLVLYSSEPLYVHNEKFRVMKISAVLGHGEGVVNDEGIGCDTVLILISESHPGELYIRYSTQEKPLRLAPVKDSQGNISLTTIENPEELKKTPILSKQILGRLYHLGIITEKFFDNQPIDMEIVIKNDVIHPVQARKLKRDILLPSYIDFDKFCLLDSPIEKELHVERILSGKASVISITNPEQICHASTLASAVKKFNASVHHLVIVDHLESTQCSHAIAQFNEASIPCLYATNARDFHTIVSEISIEKPLVACVQTSRLFLWNSLKANIENFLLEGFTEHPAQVCSSLLITKTIQQDPLIACAIPADLKQKLLELRAERCQEVALMKIEELKKSSHIAALRTKRKALKEIVKLNSLLPSNVDVAYRILKGIESSVARAFEELEGAWSNKVEDEKLRMLFHTKTLEASLIGRPKKDNILYEYSAMDASSIYESAIALISYQETLSHPAHLADLVEEGWKSFDTNVRQSWLSFLKQLEPLIENQTIPKEQIDKLKLFVKMLKETHLLSSWFILEFPKLQGNNPKEKLASLLATFPKKEFSIVHHWIDKLASTRVMKLRGNRLANLEFFTEEWEKLKNYLKEFYQGEHDRSLDSLLKTHSPMTCSIALKATLEAIELVDCSIKAMKGNPDWPRERKLIALKEMLSSYLDLLENYFLKLLDPAELKLHEKWPIEEYVKTFRKLLKEMSIDDPTSLFASQNFSVHAAVLGPHAFDRHFPKTLEDAFTLIHQNFLMVLSDIYQKQYSDQMLLEAPLPNLFKEAIKKIPEVVQEKLNLSGDKLNNATRRLGIEITPENINSILNITLRNHSAKLDISYDATKESMTIKTFLLGDARRRWGMNKAIVLLLQDQGILNEKEPTFLSAQEVSFSWKIDNFEDLNIALEELLAIANKSLIGRAIRRDPQFIDLIERRKLMESSQGITSLVNFVKKSFKTDDWTANAGALKVLLALVEKGYAYRTAEKCAIKGLKHEDPFVRRSALQVLEGLVYQGQGLETAKQCALKDVDTIQTIPDPDIDLRLFSLDLCKALAITILKKFYGNDLPAEIQEKYLNLSKIDAKLYSLENIIGFLKDATKELFGDGEKLPPELDELFILFSR